MMITLSSTTVRKIQGLLEPGYVVEVQQVGNEVLVTRRAKRESNTSRYPQHGHSISPTGKE